MTNEKKARAVAKSSAQDKAELVTNAIQAGFGILGYVRFVVANEEAVEGDLQNLRKFLDAMDELYESAERDAKKRGKEGAK